MNNVFVYLEIEGTTVADVSLELLTKGRKLANQLGCQLEAVAAGSNLAGIEKQVLPYGVDKLHVFDAPGLFPYTSLPHSSILINLFKEEKPQICLTKYAINKLFEGLEQDRVGLVVFAGEAKVQLPITTDYRMARAFARRIDPSLVSVQGTDRKSVV